jgi:HK97 family phage prohead protease
MLRKHFFCQYQHKDDAGEGHMIEGHASIFGIPDQGTPPDIIMPGAFKKTLKEWGPQGKDRIRVLVQHRTDLLPIGRPTVLEEDARGLHFLAKISDTAMGRDVLTLIRDGVLRDMSIGFDPIKADFDQTAGVRRIREVRLWEISPVIWAMHPMARIEAVKAVPRDVSEQLADRDTQWEAPALSDFTDEAWDDLSDQEKLDIAGHYAWSPKLPPDRFTDLKLPHHDPKTGKVVWRGVVAAMTALLGGRGGVEIPARDRRAVYRHLSRHYKQFDAEPPALREADPDLEQSEAHEPSRLSHDSASLHADALTAALSAVMTDMQSLMMEVPHADADRDPRRISPHLEVIPR